MTLKRHQKLTPAGLLYLKILVISSTRIGDAVLSTGIIQHLAEQHPGAQFTIACGPVAEGVFTRFPSLHELIILRKRSFDRHWIALWRRVVGTKWDLVVDVRGSLISFLVRTKRRAVMRGGRRKGHRLTHLAGILGLNPPPLPVAWTAPADQARADTLLPAGPIYLGLGPTANWIGKVWPAERFVALFTALTAPDGPLPGAKAVIFGGPGENERALAAPVLDSIPGAIDLVGVLSLPEAAACLQRCALFVANDSGLMHLAAAAGTPTLGLFGPTPASEYGPSGRCAEFVAASSELVPIEDVTLDAAIEGARGLLGLSPYIPAIPH